MLKQVVLPAPFGPINATTPPCGTSNDASCTARSPRNALPTPLTSSSAMGRPRLAEELDGGDQGNNPEQRNEQQQVDADIALSSAQDPGLHQRFIDRVERPESSRDPARVTLPQEVTPGEQAGRDER